MSLFGEDKGSPWLQSFCVDLFNDVTGGVSGRESKERKEERNGQSSNTVSGFYYRVRRE